MKFIAPNEIIKKAWIEQGIPEEMIVLGKRIPET